jgi:hypothetical protein
MHSTRIFGGRLDISTPALSWALGVEPARALLIHTVEEVLNQSLVL